MRKERSLRQQQQNRIVCDGTETTNQSHTTKQFVTWTFKDSEDGNTITVTGTFLGREGERSGRGWEGEEEEMRE